MNFKRSPAVEQYQNNVKHTEIQNTGKDFILNILCSVDFSSEQCINMD